MNAKRHRGVEPATLHLPTACHHKALPLVNVEHAAKEDRLIEEDFDELQGALVAYIADHEEDPQEVIRWAQDALPQAYERIFHHADPATNARVAYWLARECWDATPLAVNGFRPSPLPEPKDEEPCPCGSSGTYEACCMARRPDEPPMPEEIWPSLVAHRGDAYWLTAEKAGKLPTLGLVNVVEHYHTSKRWQALKTLAEARLTVRRRCTAPEIALVIQWLCDAYDQLQRTPRKKLALLKRFAKHETPDIRASANRRLAFASLDAGDKKAAAAASAKARQADPDGLGTALHEVLLLVEKGELDLAAEQAEYWHERLSGRDDLPDGTLEVLSTIAGDPVRAFENARASQVAAPVRALLDWIDRHIDRPLPRQRWRAIAATGDHGPLRNACLPVVGRGQRVLEEDWLALSGLQQTHRSRSLLRCRGPMLGAARTLDGVAAPTPAGFGQLDDSGRLGDSACHRAIPPWRKQPLAPARTFARRPNSVEALAAGARRQAAVGSGSKPTDSALAYLVRPRGNRGLGGRAHGAGGAPLPAHESR